MRLGFGRGRLDPRLGAARVAVNFMALATLSFAAGSLAAPWAIPAVGDFFYQPPVLAWVHTFTLGWISSAIIGAMFFYLPALTRQPLRYPRLAQLQFLLYLIGASGVVSHFLLGSWDGVWMAGVVVAISVLLFALNLMPALAPRARRGGVELGLLLALGFFALASILGILLALDKSLDFLGGDVLRNLAAHAHLAAIGWIALAICAMSYRLAPAVAGAPLRPARAGFAFEIGALSLAAIGLTLALAGEVPRLPLWAGAVALALVIYLVTMGRLLRTPGLIMTWPRRHLAASLVSLALALVLGLILSLTGAQSTLGNRLAGAYGLLALLGWIGNLVIGASYQLFPAAVARTRALHRWPARGPAQMVPGTARGAVFCSFNLALIGMVLGLLADRGRIAEGAALLLAASGLSYSAASAWTLAFAYRRG